MRQDEQSLPSYVNAPVAEVAWAVHFNPLAELDVSHLAALREAFRERYPRFQQQPPLPPQGPEELGGELPVPQFSIQIQPMTFLPRCWYLSQAEDLLVQVQQDRFVLNWRNLPNGSDYPRHAAMRERLRAEFTLFNDTLLGQGLPPLTRLNAELTYINHIRPAEGIWSDHAQAARVFRAWKTTEVAGLRFEEVRFADRYTFENAAGQPTGRLYVVVEPVVDFPSATPAYRLVLTARGGESPNAEDLLDFFDEARRSIVRTFDEMLTSEMQEVLGRT